MESEDVELYKLQLIQVNEALENCNEDQKEELLILKSNIEELLSLASSAEQHGSVEEDTISKEYELFMAEMEKEGVTQSNTVDTENCPKHLSESLGEIEGKKCRAPHKHQWGNIAYHNAMICSAFEDDEGIKVRVLFTNPTDQEMLPCPYYYESDCKFSEDKCRFSHGEVVLYSSLQEYIEPKFDQLIIGSTVLAKQENNLWQRALIQSLYNDKCQVRFESSRKSIEVLLENVFPLDNSDEVVDLVEDDSGNENYNDKEDIINMSLIIKPSSTALGDWEKYTKGIGSKLMQKMGYIVGTGLGKNAEGRINPVTAVILPAGKSLDHCMHLREQSGGDKNLFSVERKLKRLQRKQERQSERAYERESKQKNVFDFLNSTLSNSGKKRNADSSKNERQQLKEESLRNLNIKTLQISGNMKRIEDTISVLKNSLDKHSDSTTNTHQKILSKIAEQQDQFNMYQKQVQMIKNELDLRNDRKKLTEF